MLCATLDASHTSQVFRNDGSLPDSTLPPFDHSGDSMLDSAVGNAVLIPKAKYPKVVAAEANGRDDDFLGWVGKIISYESKRTKLKVKVYGDQGYEHLPLTGSKFAISELVRLT